MSWRRKAFKTRISINTIAERLSRRNVCSTSAGMQAALRPAMERRRAGGAYGPALSQRASMSRACCGKAGAARLGARPCCAGHALQILSMEPGAVQPTPALARLAVRDWAGAVRGVNRRVASHRWPATAVLREARCRHDAQLGVFRGTQVAGLHGAHPPLPMPAALTCRCTEVFGTPAVHPSGLSDFAQLAKSLSRKIRFLAPS